MRRRVRLVRWSLLAMALYVVGTLDQVALAARHEEAAPADAIVVLGAAQWAGRPSPVLRARLDHAIALYHQGYAPLLVTTGGHGPDPLFSEAGVGARYAEARGVPRAALLSEELGISTWTSMQQVAALAKQHNFQRVIVVSDPFHIARSKAMAAGLGLEPLGSPTRSSPISRRLGLEVRYMVGEVGSLTHFRLRQLSSALMLWAQPPHTAKGPA